MTTSDAADTVQLPALDWPSIARGCLIAAAAAQLSAAAVFFFAANWFRISGWTKIIWVDAALLGLAFAAAVAGRGTITRSSFAFAGAMLSGVLFAVHSQIWQTGADAWTLFAVWAVAAALWAAMSEATAVWLLVVILAVVASVLWLLDGRVLSTDDSFLVLLVPIGVLAVAGALIRLMRRRWPRQAPSAYLPISIEVAAVAGTAALGGLVGVWFPGAWTLALAAGLLIAGSLLLFRRLAPSPTGYATAAAAVLVFAAAVGTRLSLFADIDSDRAVLLLLLIVAVALMFGVRALTRHLRGLAWPMVQGTMAISLSQGAAVRAAAVGAVAWLGAFLWGAASRGLTDGVTDLGGAIAAAIAAFVLARRGEYSRRIAGALAVVAVWMLASASLGNFGLFAIAVIATVAAAAMTWLVLLRVGGVDSGFMMATGLAGMWLAVMVDEAQSVLPLAVPVLAGLGWLVLRQQAPVFVGAGAALLGTAFFAPSLFEVILELRFVGDLWQRFAAVISAGLLVAAAAHGAGWRLDLRVRAMIAGAFAVCIALPGGAAGTIGLFAMAAWRNSLGLLGFALTLAVWSVGRFYYALEQPLADKAVLMAVGGVLALAAWAVLAPPPGRFRPSVGAPAGFAAIVLTVAIAEAQDGLAKAAVVRDGTRILLRMAPVDPRSLVQGDYMAIRYRLQPQLVGLGSSAALTMDEAGIVQSARRDDGSLKPNEVRVSVHGSAEEPRVAPTSFLFEEGTADTWSKAVLVEARVKDGALVMTGLTDAEGRRLEPPARP